MCGGGGGSAFCVWIGGEGDLSFLGLMALTEAKAAGVCVCVSLVVCMCVGGIPFNFRLVTVTEAAKAAGGCVCLLLYVCVCMWGGGNPIFGLKAVKEAATGAGVCAHLCSSVSMRVCVCVCACGV